MSECPSSERLQQFLDDPPDGQDHLELAGHIEACRGCQVALEHLTESELLITSPFAAAAGDAGYAARVVIPQPLPNAPLREAPPRSETVLGNGRLLGAGGRAAWTVLRSRLSQGTALGRAWARWHGAWHLRHAMSDWTVRWP